MSNIQLNYLYRCAGNYKNFGQVIFSNPDNLPIHIIDQNLRDELIDGSWFYANKWLVPDLHFPNWDKEMDHDLHEFENLETTEEPPTDNRSIRQFLRSIS